jgi:hypothetical protein
MEKFAFSLPRGYVLVRTDGKYVAPQGSYSSYVSKLENARIYPTRDEAENDRCVENETIRSVSECLEGMQYR